MTTSQKQDSCQLRSAASSKSGEDRIRPGRFSHPLARVVLALGLLNWQRVTRVRLVLIFAGCCGMLGIGSNTVSAQSPAPSAPAPTTHVSDSQPDQQDNTP